jgi:hypothetical protein
MALKTYAEPQEINTKTAQCEPKGVMVLLLLFHMLFD